MENHKKAFDPSVCFTFFGNWVEAIQNFETDADKNSTAYMLFKSIANYSMYNLEPDFDEKKELQVFAPFWPMFVDQIDHSIGRRKSGFGAEEPTKKQNTIIKAAIDNPGASYRDIAIISNASKSSVERTLKKYGAKIEDGRASASTTVNPVNLSTSNATYSVGTGQRDTLPFQPYDGDDEGLPF